MSSCKTQSFFKKLCPFTKNKVLELNITRNIDDFQKEWSELEITDIFFQLHYLNVMQNYGNPSIDNYFVILKDANIPIAAFLFQLTEFDFRDRITDDNNNNSIFKKFLTEKINYKILVHGNLYQSGNHMNYFKNQDLTTEEKSEYVLDAMEEMSQYLFNENILVEALLVKDLDQGEQKSLLLQYDGKYTSFCVDPNMILPIKSNWTNMEDYLSDLRSKYRVRYRKARTEINDLTLRTLSYEDLLQHSDRIYDLYVNTAEESDFNIGLLQRDYFSKLKESLANYCEFYGYFDGDKLIAFYSDIKNNTIYSAHFLGFDSNYNQTHKLYLNILYNLVENCIQGGFKTLNFSRTALEIKSTVGAEPHELYCYIRMDSHIKNKLLPHVLKRFIPKLDWIQRSPFKTIL